MKAMTDLVLATFGDWLSLEANWLLIKFKWFLIVFFGLIFAIVIILLVVVGTLNFFKFIIDFFHKVSWRIFGGLPYHILQIIRIEEALDAGNIIDFTNIWKKLKPDVQEGISEKFCIVDNEKFGDQLIEYLKNRFLKAKFVEKRNIALAFGYIGTNCELLEEKTTDILLGYLNKEKDIRIIEGILIGLHWKLPVSSFFLKGKEKITESQKKRVENILQQFWQILESKKDESLKKICIKDICVHYGGEKELASKTNEILRNVLTNQQISFELQSMAVDELANMVSIDLVKRGDIGLMSNFKKRFVQKEEFLKDETAQLRFLNGLLRAGDQTCLNMVGFYLKQGSPDVKSDNFSVVAHRAKEAWSTIMMYDERE